jgi:hypothetical protein
MTQTSLPFVVAEQRSANGMTLNVDPVSLAALSLAREAGIERASDFGALPDLDELPLRVVCLEARMEQLEQKLGRYGG